MGMLLALFALVSRAEEAPEFCLGKNVHPSLSIYLSSPEKKSPYLKAAEESGLSLYSEENPRIRASDLERVTLQEDSNSLLLELNLSGKKKLAKATARAPGKYLTFKLKERSLVSARISSPMDDGKALLALGQGGKEPGHHGFFGTLRAINHLVQFLNFHFRNGSCGEPSLRR